MRLALGLAQAALLSACASVPTVTSPGAGSLTHVVALWIKDTAPADLRTRIVEFYTHRLHGSVPGIEVVWIGSARPSTRDVVDDTFSLMSIVRFADSAAEVGWQSHPVHEELRTLFGTHLAKVTVYDFVE